MSTDTYITQFAEVLLPLPVKGYFTYRIPMELNDAIIPGIRVVVQFGSKKLYSALVRRLTDKPPKVVSAKYILSIVDPIPVVNEKQFLFWEWMAEYYMCTEGEVMNAALPSAYKLASETRIVIDPEYVHDSQVLSDMEFMVIEALDLQKLLSITEISRIVGISKVIPLVKTMLEKKYIRVEEEITERYKPRVEWFVRLSEKCRDDKLLQEEMDKLNTKAYKQLELLMAYINLSHCFTDKPKEVSRVDLLKTPSVSAAQLDALVKKDILELYQRNVSRLETRNSSNIIESIVFTPAQQIAFEAIRDYLKNPEVALLKGVTSSGKTEIYIRLMHEVISKGEQVLYLLPEIALTSQIVRRLQIFFGNDVGVYHSRYNEFERIEIWSKSNESMVKDDSGIAFKIILGARSSMFLPFNKLGLIIVDEEHDGSYKQSEPAPRYNARDSAIMLGRLHNAPVLLGSATPSLESYYNAQAGKYKLIELTERYGGVDMPAIKTVNIKEESRFKRMKSHFSPQLVEAIEGALKLDEQVILFQNRRGFSLRMECETCNHIPGCVNCDVTLTYHKHVNVLKCHYCGFTQTVPRVCPECGSANVRLKGFGTEKVEEDLALLFPDITIARMDLDTTHTKNAYHKIMQEFETRKTDILVGTQMVTKGLDFDNVSLVGVLNADGLISYPDFRALERSFQMLAQVSGRAGRKAKQGLVMIQTFNPAHPIHKWVIDNDYEAMYQQVLLDRYKFSYPPYVRLISISLRHKEEKILDKAAAKLAELLKPHFGKMMLGPEYPNVSRVKNFYLKNLLLKISKGQKGQDLKVEAGKQIELFKQLQDFKSVRVVIDVDPM
ncbi:MAG TPA: primosomal protein N' [Lentimicrobium sp.]|nr:primosomal protein N' [Lentimicrobium sp.]